MDAKYAYHALACANENDYQKLSRLKLKYENWERAWEAAGINVSTRAHTSWKTLEREHMKLILLEEGDYPERLREIPHPPFGIYVRGALPAPGAPTLAIVGTRKASEAGRALAREWAAHCAGRDIVIVSGLALGIDAASHEGALDAKGLTLAVLGNGANEPYPRTNAPLGERIVEAGGALLSEYPPGSPPLPYRFLERNRIVSGLSDGVLVIEAGETSGALVTARFALEQNRSVFVVPGSIGQQNFKGSHKLIREGAELVTSPDDILLSLYPNLAPARAPSTPEEETIIAALRASKKPIPIDKVIEITNLETHVVSRAISFLIMKEIVKETVQGYTIQA